MVKLPRHQLPPVVLVDDDPDDLFVLSDRLRRASVINPLVAFDKASDAIGFLKAALDPHSEVAMAPCIVITDLKMPGLDGFQFTGWVRAQPELAQVPIVALSSESDPRDAARALRLGANAWYPKFPRAEALVALIARASKPRVA